MAQLLTGSLDFSKLIEAAKTGHKAFYKSPKSGRIYFNFAMWVNDQKDDYGNDGSIQASFKDSTKEDRFYCGNIRKQEAALPEPVTEQDFPNEDDFPF